MNIKIKIPDYVKKLMRYLDTMGFEAFVVGGCVRDCCLGKSPLDWDVCTNATPDIMIKILQEKFSVIPTGIKHGTVTVISDGKQIEVTTYRSDGKYLDSRHPECVNFLPSIEGDLSRRDFTVNAIAYNEKIGFVDLFDGILDINNKILRAVGEASIRFSEDALRILRGLRFSAVCSFEIEEETKNAIHSSKNLLKNISAERIYTEIEKLLLAKYPSKILIEYRDVFEVIIPEVFGEKFFDRHICKMVDKMPYDKILRLATMLVFAKNPNEILKRLKVDNQTRKKVCSIIENADIELPQDKIAAKKMLKKFGKDLTYNIIEISGIKRGCFDEMSKIREVAREFTQSILKSEECYCLGMLAIDGSDLIQAGFEKGPEIGNILNRLLDEVIDEKIENNYKILINCAKKSLT